MIGQVYVCDWLINREKGVKSQIHQTSINQKHVKPSRHGVSRDMWSNLRNLSLNSKSENKLKTKKQRSRTWKETMDDASANSPILPKSHDLFRAFWGWGFSDSKSPPSGTGEFPSSGAFRCSLTSKNHGTEFYSWAPKRTYMGLVMLVCIPLRPTCFCFLFFDELNPSRKGGFMAIVMAWTSLKVLEIKGGRFW